MDISAKLLKPLRVLGAEEFSVVLNMVSNGDYRVYCDYPAEWQEYYFRTALYLSDPVFRMAEHLPGPLMWSEIAAPCPRGNVVDLARDFGLTHGITLPVRLGHNLHLVSMTLNGTADATRSHRDALLRASRRLVAILDDQTEQKVSRMQSRIAFLSSQGMSPTEIADVLTQSVNRRPVLPDPTALPSFSLH